MAKNKTQRTDPHRPGAIIPAHYEQWNDYSLASGLVPAIGVDCTQPVAIYDDNGHCTGYTHPTCNDTGRCCVASTHRHALREGRAIFGGLGKCGVCGAHYTYGTMFKHEPTGAIVHMGHDCADKYGAMYDLSAWEVENNRVRAATAKAVQRAQNDEERTAFLDAHPGLAAELALGNETSTRGAAILADLARKFTTYRTMSDKQIAFAAKLANEIRNPAPPKAEELKVNAPSGKAVEFEGEIVSVKLSVSEQWGASWKCTIKVATDAGIWLAWGSLPSSMLSLVEHLPYGDKRESAIRAEFVGMRVAVKATLELGTDREVETYDHANETYTRTVKKADPAFAFMKRPTMSPAGLVLHPVYKAPKAKRAKVVRECRGCGAPEGMPHLTGCEGVDYQ